MIVRSDREDCRINEKDIYYMEAAGHYVLIHKLNPFVCHRRKPTTFRWWEEPCESLAINPDSQYTFV